MLFKDSKFEEMDELTKMIEPFENEDSEVINKIPAKIDATEYIISDIVNCNSSSPYLDDIESLFKVIYPEIRMGHNIVDKFFKYEIECAEEELTVNAKTQEINGKIFIVKKKEAFEDKEVQQQIKDDMANIFRKSRDYMYADKDAINEMAVMFGLVYEDLRGKKATPRKKVIAFGKCLIERFDACEYKIRSLRLSQRINRMIRDYFRGHGNKENILFNLTQIAVMVNSGLPIYSLDEMKEIV